MAKASSFASVAHRRLRWLNIAILASALVPILLPIITAPIAPVVLLKADNPSVLMLGGFPRVYFGTFGYCVDIISHSDGSLIQPRSCSPRQLGYDTAELVYSASAGYQIMFSFANYIRVGSGGTVGSLMRGGAIVHPITFALTVIAFVLSAWPKRTSYVSPTVWTMLACFSAAIAVGFNFGFHGLMARDYVRHPTPNNRPGQVTVGAAMITMAVGFCLLFLSSAMSLFICCSSRKQGKKQALESDVPPTYTRKDPSDNESIASSMSLTEYRQTIRTTDSKF